MADHPVILGVYSLKQETQIGMGDSATKRETVTYWYVRQLDRDRFEVQPLNIHHVPSGVKQELAAREFLTSYSPEPQYYRMFTVPALNSLARKLDKGRELFAAGQIDDAEKALLKALMIDDRNVEANYALGEVYSEKNDFDKLRKVLGALLQSDEAFSQEHRERFNAFGIDLRENKLLDEALGFYARALELDAMDEHVYFNMARACYEKHALEECMRNLDIALAVNPEFEEARKFMDFCRVREAKNKA